MGSMPASIATTWKRRDEPATASAPRASWRPQSLAPLDPDAVAPGAAPAARTRGARQGRLDAAERKAGPAGIAPPARPAGLGAWRQRGRKPVGAAIDRKNTGIRRHKCAGDQRHRDQ